MGLSAGTTWPDMGVTSARKVIVADAFPEILEGLEGEQALSARRHLVAGLVEVEPGTWEPPRDVRDGPGHLGLLVIDGLMTRDVVLDSTLATELVGRGDVLRPSDHDSRDAPVPFDIAWQVLEPARMAVLDRQFAQAAMHWPEVMEVLFRGAVRRAQSLAIGLAVSNMRRVDQRLLSLMWYLADRWGKVTPAGVRVPLKLTHQTLGRLVGAQRPSVSTALGQLAEDGILTRAADGTWVLHGEAPAWS